jgi:hypothetical protein
MNTISEAKEFLRAGYDKGVTCPCCGQLAKLYKRKINSGMALFLIGLYRLNQKNPGAEFSNKSVMSEMNINTSSLDYSVLKHFNVVQGSVANKGDWSITPFGIAFVEGSATLPEKVLIYNNKKQGYDGDRVTIQQALTSKFNLTELLSL